MIKFEIVEAYKDKIDESFIPVRGTESSAGYDILAAEDVIIPSIFSITQNLMLSCDEIVDKYDTPPYSLGQIDEIIKKYSQRLPLIPTGLKAYFPSDMVLSIRSRSSVPLKYLLMVANGPATIDSRLA